MIDVRSCGWKILLKLAVSISEIRKNCKGQRLVHSVIGYSKQLPTPKYWQKWVVHSFFSIQLGIHGREDMNNQCLSGIVQQSSPSDDPVAPTFT